MAKRYRVEITRTAERDIQSIYSVIARDNPAVARRWVREIERQIATLERSPARCAVISESEELGREYRHLLYGAYRTIFRIDKARVIIVRVIHGARLLALTPLE